MESPKVQEVQTWLRILQSVTHALGAATTIEDVAKIAFEQSEQVLGAFNSNIQIYHPEDETLEIAYIQTITDKAVFDQWRRYPMRPNYPMTDVVRGNQSLWFASFDEVVQMYPEMTPYRQAYPGAAALLPLYTGGRVLGGMSMSFKEERLFSLPERELIQSIAQQCAQAFDRARAFAAEREARLKAEESDRLKTQFLAMVSHELRTPLTSILGFSSTLLSEGAQIDPDLSRQFLSIIDQEAGRMTQLVEQLIDLSRLQGRVMALTLDETRLNDVIEGAETQLRTMTDGHPLRIDLPDDLPLVRADHQRVTQILFNLVENAAAHTADGTPISVRARVEHQAVRVEVADEGEGIPDEMRLDIFEPFKQLPPRKHASRQGLGLGLAICRGLVEAHGGLIWIEDNKPRGTCVVFTLPLSTA